MSSLLRRRLCTIGRRNCDCNCFDYITTKVAFLSSFALGLRLLLLARVVNDLQGRTEFKMESYTYFHFYLAQLLHGFLLLLFVSILPIVVVVVVVVVASISSVVVAIAAVSPILQLLLPLLLLQLQLLLLLLLLLLLPTTTSNNNNNNNIIATRALLLRPPQIPYFFC